tara:strand:+ start:45 stop:305 length:261 start_codon:yes stop_codon:yes gene_type:complete
MLLISITLDLVIRPRFFSFSCLVDNHGTSQTAEAFSRIFKDIFYIERDEERSKIISFLDNEVLDELQKTEYKITEVSSLISMIINK